MVHVLWCKTCSPFCNLVFILLGFWCILSCFFQCEMSLEFLLFCKFFILLITPFVMLLVYYHWHCPLLGMLHCKYISPTWISQVFGRCVGIAKLFIQSTRTNHHRLFFWLPFVCWKYSSSIVWLNIWYIIVIIRKMTHALYQWNMINIECG